MISTISTASKAPRMFRNVLPGERKGQVGQEKRKRKGKVKGKETGNRKGKEGRWCKKACVTRPLELFYKLCIKVRHVM